MNLTTALPVCTRCKHLSLILAWCATDGYFSGSVV